MRFILILFLTFNTILNACNSNVSVRINDNIVVADNEKAAIISVSYSGTENNYHFNVGISSPDKGCSQYADWWEVIAEDGTLLYRRILAHSHVNEQPFVRSGGSVKITSSQTVIIRAHMNNSGYGIKVFKGSVGKGFTATKLDDDFAKKNETINPLPSKCTS